MQLLQHSFRVSLGERILLDVLRGTGWWDERRVAHRPPPEQAPSASTVGSGC